MLPANQRYIVGQRKPTHCCGSSIDLFVRQVTMTSPLKTFSAQDGESMRAPEVINTPASPGNDDEALAAMVGSPLPAVSSTLSAQSSYDQTGSASATPTMQRRKSKNLMGLKILPSPRASPLPSPKNSPFMKRKSSFSTISSALFRNKTPTSGGTVLDNGGLASPRVYEPQTPGKSLFTTF